MDQKTWLRLGLFFFVATGGLIFMPNVDLFAMYADRQQGMTYKQLAKKYNCCVGTAWHRIEKAEGLYGAQYQKLYWYWQNPDKIQRLRTEDLKNEGCIKLCETVLGELKIEMEFIERVFRTDPDNKDVIMQLQRMWKTLNSKYMDAITFGHGSILAQNFRAKLPEKVRNDLGSSGEDE